MTNEEYRDLFRTEVLPNLTDPAVSVGYFDGHWPRFEAQLDMMRGLEGVGLVYDVGTGHPFTSYYLHLTQGAEVVYGCPREMASVSDQVRFQNMNLCNPSYLGPAADLVICTECLEHIPCPITGALVYLKSLVKPGGHLLLSFPFGPILRGGLSEDFGDYQREHSHLREFTRILAEETIRDWARWPIVSEKETFTKAYGGTIWNVLVNRPRAII